MVDRGLARGLVVAHLHEPLGERAVELDLVDRLAGAHVAQLGRAGRPSARAAARATRAPPPPRASGSPAAVPDVHVTATGRPVALAIPSATNPAERSSITECAAIRGSSASMSESGALREPGRGHGVRHPAASQLVHEGLDRCVRPIDRDHAGENEGTGRDLRPRLHAAGRRLEPGRRAGGRTLSQRLPRLPHAQLRGPARRAARGGTPRRRGGRLLDGRPAGPPPGRARA